jgi:hypothetical protein
LKRSRNLLQYRKDNSPRFLDFTRNAKITEKR